MPGIDSFRNHAWHRFVEVFNLRQMATAKKCGEICGPKKDAFEYASFCHQQLVPEAEEFAALCLREIIECRVLPAVVANEQPSSHL